MRAKITTLAVALAVLVIGLGVWFGRHLSGRNLTSSSFDEQAPSIGPTIGSETEPGAEPATEESTAEAPTLVPPSDSGFRTRDLPSPENRGRLPDTKVAAEQAARLRFATLSARYDELIKMMEGKESALGSETTAAVLQPVTAAREAAADHMAAVASAEDDAAKKQMMADVETDLNRFERELNAAENRLIGH